MCSVPQGANPLTEIIRAEIGDGGPMPFARFMALALYHPEFGYYEKDTGQVGRRGDFITSVSVGAVFGQLLAFRFAKNGAGDDQALAFDLEQAVAFKILYRKKENRRFGNENGGENRQRDAPTQAAGLQFRDGSRNPAPNTARRRISR